jgi:hypothetical protein
MTVQNCSKCRDQEKCIAMKGMFECPYEIFELEEDDDGI